MRNAIRLVLVLGFGLGTALPLAAQTQPTGFSGPYLAARHAIIEGDHETAAVHLLRTLAADPSNLAILENAILSLAASGDWDRAVELAASIPADIAGRDLANMIELVDMVRRGELAEAAAAILAGNGAGQFVDDLLIGWLHLGAGDMRSAVADFEDIAGSDSPLAGLAQYQLALARASVGDFEGADEILSGREYGPLQASVRGVQAHAQVLLQLDRQDSALELLDLTIDTIANPMLMALREQIAADPTRPYDFVVNARQGASEVFYALSRALGGDTGSSLPLLYARAAYAIDPGNVDAALQVAQLLIEVRQYPMAVTAFALVPTDHPDFVTAELGRSDALFEMDRQDAAVEVMQALARAHPDMATVHAGLGDTLRRLERYDEAVAAYTRALDLVDQSQRRYWFLFYARGICNENTDRLEAAETDFRAALALEPDQPQVLNYLGYSLVEQRRNLDEALDMIERAVAARPDSGYIVDSLGWVFYRLERYAEAVEPMERAVELLPNDSIVNDHLGDVYWKVGRFREARFQWSRALSFDPEPAEAERIRRKLEVGLDVVLADEAANQP